MILVLVLVLVGACQGISVDENAAGDWKHDWNTPASAWWGYGGLANRGLTDEQVEMVANTYKIVVLSMCVGDLNVSVSETLRNISMRLKAVTPTIKVIQYFNVEQWACYEASDPWYSEFLKHTEWWLKDDHGSYVEPWHLDYTNADAVEWLVSLPLAGTDGPKTIDGLLLDGAAGYNPNPNISAARSEKLEKAKRTMVGKMQKMFTDTNGGLIVANGMSGTVDPNSNDPYNLGVLDFSNGIENERGTPTFEFVNHTTGAMLKDMVAANLEGIEKAAGLANGSKVVSMNYWAGPIVGFSRANDTGRGLPIYAPEDPVNKVPSGTRAQVYAGWSKILETWFPINLAFFLLVAGPSSYFTQNVWYADFQGFLSCPDAPDTCMAPSPFYPAMNNKLGPPKGPRVQLGTYKWKREFEYATVNVDLDDVHGPGTGIQWHSN